MMTEGLSVAVIEDQPLMRVALSQVLAANNMKVIAMLPARMEILEIFKDKTPDVILIALGTEEGEDLKLMSGLRGLLPGTSIVALITDEIASQDLIALVHGANLVVKKTCSHQELITAIEDFQKSRLYPVVSQDDQ
jgi:DNA-binding NarL/FixJ family response regulator